MQVKGILKWILGFFYIFKKQDFCKKSNCIFGNQKKICLTNMLEFWNKNWSLYVKPKSEVHNVPLDF